jgi:chromosome segregation ATPase
MEQQNVDNLERRMGKVENRLTAIEVESIHSNDLTEKLAVINETLSKTLHEIQLVMKDMSYQLQHTQQNTEMIGKDLQSYKSEVATQFDKFKQNVCEIDDKLSEVDEKSKVDILLWFKVNWFKIFFVGSVIGYFIKTYIIV